ncbi:hypothetical protein BLNAU_4721 [Blattamonas nauphoetae]|uniref:Uncharacterized protein n=1 Tax=Blattamonas nauphoetae TaxID=2049346 RepID=A0ABQ9Y8U1_9EUKA|nr:hypothetical protein BLNAU_4721 [Blattamonas nauphoetae]
MMKFKPDLDDSLEGKAVQFLETVDPEDEKSAAAFLSNFASPSDDSTTNFIQSIVVLISATSQVITTATMKMLKCLFFWSSAEVQLALVKANLIPQIINNLSPQSLSFAETVDIHINLMEIIQITLWLATPFGLTQLGFEDGDEQQAVHETVLTQVVAPSEKYIWDLCVNRYSIVDGDQSKFFLSPLLFSGRSFVTSQINPNLLLANNLSHLTVSLIQPLRGMVTRVIIRTPTTLFPSLVIAQIGRAKRRVQNALDLEAVQKDSAQNGVEAIVLVDFDEADEGDTTVKNKIDENIPSSNEGQ